MNFEVNTTNTFGILAPPNALDDARPDDQPALVFINAVDPTIPISSNKSQTLPSRQKVVQRTEVTQESFKPPQNVFNSGDILKCQSTGSIDKLAVVSQPLTESLQLPVLTKQKANNHSLHSPVYDVPKTSETQSAGPKHTENDDYMFMQLIGKPEKQPVSSSLAATSQHDGPGCFPVGVNDKDRKAPEEGLYDVPKSMRKEQKSSLPDIEISTVLLEAPPPDASHYDVPRRLLLQNRAVYKESGLDSTSMADNSLSSNDIKGPVSKPEGIYDVPRSVLMKKINENCAMDSQEDKNQKVLEGVSPPSPQRLEGKTKPIPLPRRGKAEARHITHSPLKSPEK